jgi:phage gpG-like protein
MSNNIKRVNFLQIKDNLLRDTARISAVESVKFFKNSFVKGGFSDTSFQKWPDRKSPFGGKRMMYNRGTLMQSIRKIEESTRRVVIASDVIYSEIHNEGGEITITKQMKKYWWAQYYKLSGKVKQTKSGKASKSASNNQISAKAAYCKNMALMKEGTKIKIPKRQFIGESKILMNNLDKHFGSRIEFYFNKA